MSCESKRSGIERSHRYVIGGRPKTQEPRFVRYNQHIRARSIGTSFDHGYNWGVDCMFRVGVCGRWVRGVPCQELPK